MADQAKHEAMVREVWRTYLTTGEYVKETRQRRLFRRLPGPPDTRCKNCYAPFEGIGARIVRVIYNKHPSTYNPRICNACEEFAREFQGGAEVELSMLFADVRGSTTLAEGMSPSAFSALIDRFYQSTTDVLIHTDALIDKLAGDEVTAFYFPGFAGPEHAKRAVGAAQELLRVTGHGEPGGPWIPVGVGIHTGTAFFGVVGTETGMRDITALGDAVNVAARLASQAGPGEVVVSEATGAAAGLDTEGLEHRQLDLKGKSESVNAWVIHVAPGR
jgi:adenylate cyclase